MKMIIVENMYGENIALNLDHMDAITQHEDLCIAHFGAKSMRFKYDFDELSSKIVELSDV